jgi:hypothetical protein
MLKVLEYKEKKSANIEFDVYTPINIEFGSWNISKEPTIYWRTGDFKKSLMEIGMGKNRGDIRSITLTLSDNVYKIDKVNTKNLRVIEGIPVIQVDKFMNETYVDEKCELKVYIGVNKVYISFSENEIVSIIQNDSVGFCLDNNEMICSIIVKDIGENEKITLEEALE